MKFQLTITDNSISLIQLIFISVFLVFLLSLNGCSKEAVKREPLPDIVWPKAPEIPRILFVNSISRPHDVQISENAFKKFIRYFMGGSAVPIKLPYGITSDSEGKLYVVDTTLKLVHVYDRKANAYYAFPTKKVSFTSPIDIAVDLNGRVFVTDSKEAVVKVFEKQGKQFVREIGNGIFERPTGIAVNEITGELLVVDTVGSDVIKFDLTSLNFKGRIGRNGSEPGMFHYPTNISVASDGHIIVSDALNFRVQIFTPEGDFSSAFGKPGNSPGYFARPKGVAVDSDRNIYVVDALFDNVQIFNTDGRFLMHFGGPGNGYGEFWLPSGIFIDSDDKIYVSDSYNKRIQVFKYMKGDGVIRE